MKTNKNSILLTLTMILGITFFTACEKEQAFNAPKAKEIVPSINFTPAKTSAELMALRTDGTANLIRTIGDFDAAVASQATPLSKLSATELAEFKNSLVVRDSIGVVSMHYGVLEQALSYDDFAVAMTLFGLDIKQGYWGLSNDPAIQAKLGLPSLKVNSENAVAVVKDYIGYYCSLKKTCTQAKDYICMSGC